jgi:hypothetical protein
MWPCQREHATPNEDRAMPFAARHRDDHTSQLTPLPSLVVRREVSAAVMAALQGRTETEIARRFGAGHRAYVALWEGQPAADDPRWRTRSGAAPRAPGGSRAPRPVLAVPAFRGDCGHILQSRGLRVRLPVPRERLRRVTLTCQLRRAAWGALSRASDSPAAIQLLLSIRLR